MMLSKAYRGFHFQVQRHDAGEPMGRDLTLGDTIPIIWLLWWRSFALQVVPAGLVRALAVGMPQLAPLLGVVGPPVLLFLIYPWVVRMMTRKRFRACHVVPVRGHAANTGREARLFSLRWWRWSGGG
jgi:hypothetical protein